MKVFSIKVLAKGDALFEYSDNRIIIKKKNGEYWVYELVADAASGIPILKGDSITKITYGKGSVEFYDPKTQVTIRA